MGCGAPTYSTWTNGVRGQWIARSGGDQLPTSIFCGSAITKSRRHLPMPGACRDAQIANYAGTNEMRPIFLAFSVLLASLPVRAAISGQWGCEVLLCAASSNPSWHDVAECHPPMDRLIAAMKTPGFSWPTCPESGAGKPGYEAFLDRPAGWQPTSGGIDAGSFAHSEMSRCMRKRGDCHSSETQPRSKGTIVRRIIRDDGRCELTEFAPRPRRDKPYFFEIEEKDLGMTVRHYFDLRK